MLHTVVGSGQERRCCYRSPATTALPPRVHALFSSSCSQEKRFRAHLQFLTYRGAADVFLYDDHFAFVSPSTPIDIKAWVPLTALTWKRVSVSSKEHSLRCILRPEKPPFLNHHRISGSRDKSSQHRRCLRLRRRYDDEQICRFGEQTSQFSLI